MTRRFRSLVLLLSLAASPFASFGLLGCASQEQAPEAATPPPPRPKNAAEIARSIVNGRVGMMVWPERLKGHPLELRVRAMNPLRSMLEGTGIDATSDVVAAYVASTGVTQSDLAVAIVQHKLDEQRARQGLNTMVARSEPRGEWITTASVPSARVTVRGQTRVVALVEDGFLAVLPESLAPQAARFEGTGGFPDPEGPEAVVATAIEPSQSLAGSHAPRVPPTIRSAVARLRLAADGGVDVSSTGESTDPVQASADAAALTASVDRATSLNLGIVKVRLFAPVVFRAEGAQVKSDLHLTQSEIDRLLTLADTFMPR
ncbi:hypothetical protein [Polyangium sp. y55x31]|uniref:hypothetical protein n=1 Tax=Polyangium sp. y55x31 TaxID=3042688 RepID=UPI0024828151|nr:hypothetical protein [Polyangium sp. y55x31]MDI1478023.1 hypothetical protein [Polyangium sp. y55x31]